jgi:hemerythrin superfamily protein
VTEPVSERDVVDILTSDHHEVLDLIEEMKRTDDPQRLREHADTIISELVRHSVAEEMFVYPAMRRHLADGEHAVAHDIAEHKELEVTMKKLEAVDATTPEFREVLDQLEAVLRDHVHDEETEQFPELRARVPRFDLLEMATQVELAKQVAPTRPHPLAPNNKLFHLTVGPGVGLVDRLRDALTNRNP